MGENRDVAILVISAIGIAFVSGLIHGVIDAQTHAGYTAQWHINGLLSWLIATAAVSPLWLPAGWRLVNLHRSKQ